MVLENAVQLIENKTLSKLIALGLIAANPTPLGVAALRPPAGWKDVGEIHSVSFSRINELVKVAWGLTINDFK